MGVEVENRIIFCAVKLAVLILPDQRDFYVSKTFSKTVYLIRIQ